MILSDVDIKKAIKAKKIIITPTPEETQYNTSSLDLRLNGEFKEYNRDLVEKKCVEVIIDYSQLEFIELKDYFKDLKKENDGSFIIRPGAFILAQTLEKITLPIKHRIAARIEGRSSTARLGLVVHLSAPTIHAGFSGKITLEIINHGPCTIKLNPKKDRICQLIFEQILSKPGKANLSQFQGQTSIIGKKKHPQ